MNLQKGATRRWPQGSRPRKRARAGACVAMDPRDGAILGHGLGAELRRQRCGQARSRETTSKALTSQADGRAAAQPRHRLGLSDRLDVQADRGVRPRSKRGLIDSEHDDRRHRPRTARRRRRPERQGRGLRDDEHVRRLKVSSDIFFPPRRGRRSTRARRSSAGRERLGFGRMTGIDLPGEIGPVPDAVAHEGSRRTRSAPKGRRSAQTQAALYECGGIDKPWTTGDNVAWPSAGRSAGHAAAGRSRLRRAGQRRGDVTPHLGKAIEDGNGVPIQELRAKPRSKVKVDAARPPGRAGRPAPRRPRRARHLGRHLQGLPGA